MSETYGFPTWMRVLGSALALLLGVGCLFFAYQVYASPHGTPSKVLFAGLALLAAVAGTLMLRSTRRLADRITVSETEITRTSPSGRIAQMSWSDVEETMDSTAFQALELRAHGGRSRLRIEYGIAGARPLFDTIVARTAHLADKGRLPYAFEPQRQWLLLAFWLLPTAALAGSALVQWDGRGPYWPLLDAGLWFCLGLAFWLLGVRRILVEADGVTITRRTGSRSVPFSETRGIAIGVGGTGTRHLSLSLALGQDRYADLSYGGVDKIFLYHLLRRAWRARRAEGVQRGGA